METREKLYNKVLNEYKTLLKEGKVTEEIKKI